MHLLEHQLWASLKPYVDIQVYDRDGSARNPRVRIEFKKLPETLQEDALDIETNCPSCGNSMHPIRQRNAPTKRGKTGHLYYAATCPLRENIGCSRSNAARDDYLKVRASVGSFPVSDELSD